MKMRSWLKKTTMGMMAFLMIFLSVFSSVPYANAAMQVQCENGRPVGSTMDRFADMNNLFYNPCDNQYACPSGSYLDGPIALSGSTAEEKIWSGLVTFLTPEQAAGVMGNMQSESHFNPAQHEIGLMHRYQPGFNLDGHSDVSYGLGLIQWSFGRRIGMYNYVKSMDESLVKFLDDYNVYSPNYWTGEKFIQVAGSDAFDALASLELQYLKDELNNNADYGGIYGTTTVYEAADYFLRHVERPLNPDTATRAGQAQAFYDRFAGGSGGSSSSSSASSSSSSSSSFSYSAGACQTNLQGLADYVRAYVWPTYHGAGFLDRMPAYADAVGRRVATSKYVGGTVGGVPGIDCGGFVTTIMQESGYDPTYNGCASNTGPQEYWLREGGGSDKWVWLNPGGNSMNAADLQLGDVAFTGGYTGGCTAGGGHTYMFIGEINGFQTKIASASYGSASNGRAPMSGVEAVAGARWYRKVR